MIFVNLIWCDLSGRRLIISVVKRFLKFYKVVFVSYCLFLNNKYVVGVGVVDYVFCMLFLY